MDTLFLAAMLQPILIMAVMEVLVVDPENPIQAHQDFMVLLAKEG